jgi:hypothetical protein
LVSTAAERVEVERLVDTRMPIRAVAELVFGEQRYRGRVERIVVKRRRARALADFMSERAYLHVPEVDVSQEALDKLLEQLQQGMAASDP